MNNCVETVNQKIKDKYAEKGLQSYVNQYVENIKAPVVKSDTYFQKPEDLRSKSGSKIGGGIMQAMSEQKMTAKSKLPMGIQRNVVSSASNKVASSGYKPVPC